MRIASLSTLLVSSLTLGACAAHDTSEPLTRQEAEQAIDEVNLASSAQAMTYEFVELSTHFTVGSALAAAGAELRAFVESQIPCATLTGEAGVVSIDFGDLADACTFRGKTYGGVATIEIERSETNLLVHHTWSGLTQGQIALNGSADVTWSKDEASRDVSYEMVFSRDDFATSFVATGDLTQTLVDAEAGVAGGVQIDGTRMVRSDERIWQLDLDGIEVRGVDPVPQAGSYLLQLPNGKHAKLAFERLDATRIRVTVTGARGRTFHFDVVSAES